KCPQAVRTATLAESRRRERFPTPASELPTCASPISDRPVTSIDFLFECATGSRMLTALVVLLRSVGLLCRERRAVALDSLALRQQVAALTRRTKRPHLRPRDRFVGIVLAKSWREWRGALLIVQPDTVVRWHRQWLRRRWTERSRQKHPGRPRTAAIRTLVDKMVSANPLWGAPRIHGELGKLGIEVSERTVSRLVKRPRRPPPQTSRTFLTNHVPALGSMDFFTVPPVTARILFVPVVLLHHRRRIVHFNVT